MNRHSGIVWVHVAAMIAVPALTALPLGRLALAAPVAHAGGTLAALGALLMLWTLFHLGRATRAQIAPLERLITSGPFARVRHPYYVGITLVLGGYAVGCASALGLALIALGFVPLQHRRVRLEERALAESFGAEWSSYAARTGRYLPRLRPRA
jgi:protein-S-isoprenylcysteine O-methyltransferase Ste14